MKQVRCDDYEQRFDEILRDLASNDGFSLGAMNSVLYNGIFV